MTIKKLDVLFVGSGLTTVVTATRLLQFSSKPISLAFVHSTNEHNEQLNVKCLSALYQEKQAFLQWINQEPNYKPSDFSQADDATLFPYPMILSYMNHRLNHVLNQSLSGTIITELDANVLSVNKKIDSIQINLERNQNEQFESKCIQTRFICVESVNDLAHLGFSTHNTNRMPSTNEFNELFSETGELERNYFLCDYKLQTESSNSIEESSNVICGSELNNQSTRIALKMVSEMNQSKLQQNKEFSLKQHQTLFDDAVDHRVSWLSASERKKKQELIPTALQSKELLALKVSSEFSCLDQARRFVGAQIDYGALKKMTNDDQ